MCRCLPAMRDRLRQRRPHRNTVPLYGASPGMCRPLPRGDHIHRLGKRTHRYRMCPMRPGLPALRCRMRQTRLRILPAMRPNVLALRGRVPRHGTGGLHQAGLQPGVRDRLSSFTIFVNPGVGWRTDPSAGLADTEDLSGIETLEIIPICTSNGPPARSPRRGPQGGNV